MSVSFKMVGKLQMPKETEKFHPYTERVSESGWMSKRFNVNVICGTNRHMITMHDLYKVDGTGVVYTRKLIPSESGGRAKTENVQIPYKDRLKKDVIAEVASFSKYIIDLNPRNRLYALRDLKDDVADGKGITDEQLKAVGLMNVGQIEDAYADALSNRMEFITTGDMIDALKKILESGKYDDKLFSITGQCEYSYNQNADQIYESYVPERIALVGDSEVVMSTATYKLLFNKESLDGNKVTGYHFERNSNYNKNRDPESLKEIPVQTQIVVHEPDDGNEISSKKCEAILKKFKVTDDKWLEYGCVVELVDGSPRKAIKLEDLDEDLQEDIELGIITLDDIRREMGGSIYGEHIRENRFIRPSNGYSRGPLPTEYTDDDFVMNKDDGEETDLDDLFSDL